jgi:predicted kinase
MSGDAGQAMRRGHQASGALEHLASRPVLAVLIGAAGSGKSTAAANWAPSQILSLDQLRAVVAGDPCDQEATADAVTALVMLLRARLRRRLGTVIDATSASPAERAVLVAAATEHDMPAVAVVMTTSLETCLERNAARPGPVPGARWGRRVPELVVRRQHAQIQDAVGDMQAEGFSQVLSWPCASAG